jgi:hypothetical protein
MMNMATIRMEKRNSQNGKNLKEWLLIDRKPRKRRKTKKTKII